MKKLRNRILTIIILIVLIRGFGIFNINLSYAVTYSKGPIELQIDKKDINLGDTFTISVLIPQKTTSSESSRSVNNTDIIFTYDKDVLQCVKTNIPNTYEHTGFTNITKQIGQINYDYSAYSMYSIGNGTILFTATFKVISSGSTTLELIYNAQERYHITKI